MKFEPKRNDSIFCLTGGVSIGVIGACELSQSSTAFEIGFLSLKFRINLIKKYKLLVFD